MNRSMTMRSLVLAGCLLGQAFGACADDIRIAVAANFAEPLRALVGKFERRHDHRIEIVVASTGKIYAQVLNGAPYDIFFAADSERPRLLDEKGLIVPGSRRCYAIGRLVLWSADPHLVDDTGQVLAIGDFRHVAIANPRLAPYGRAAQEVLENLGHWQDLEPRIVRAENVGQAYAWVKSGNAEIGFVAASQLARVEGAVEGSTWIVPPELHEPIRQELVLLTESDGTRQFSEWIQSEEALQLTRDFGYATP